MRRRSPSPRARHNEAMDEGRGTVSAQSPPPKPRPHRNDDGAARGRDHTRETPHRGTPTRPVPRGGRVGSDPAYEHLGDAQDPAESDKHGAAPRRQTVVAAGRGAAKGGRAVAKVTAAAGRTMVRAARRASEAQGAGETGLSRLIQVHAFSSAGDAAVMVGLAGTMFFQVPSGQAKNQVLLFLVLTMLPFAIVAPLIGPLLDRFRHGRRWSIGATLAGRGFLCWVLAQTIADQSSWQFPAALGVLVGSKAYLVTRSSATPRLLPDQLTLVKANGRLSLAGTVGAALGGGLAGVAATTGSSAWALRVGFLLFVAGTVLAILLPQRVDSAVGEEQAHLLDLAGGNEGRRRGISSEVVTALRANSGLRWLSGFLTIFMAFLLRAHPFPGWEDRGSLLLALVIGAAGVGNAIGTMTGALVKVSSPRTIVLATLLADAVVTVVAAAAFGLSAAIAVGLVAGISQQMGKLALDALIQDTVPEDVRTSVFARSETLLQLSWVIGGIIAVLLPKNASVGMITAAVLLVLWTIVVLIWHTGHRLPVPERARPRSAARRRSRSDLASEGGVDDRATGRPGSEDRHAPHDDVERTVPIRRGEDPWQPPRRSGSGNDDDRRDRWSSRFPRSDR